MGRQRRARGLMAAALAGAVLVLGTGCSSQGGRSVGAAGSGSATVAPAAGASAGAAASVSPDRCSVMITGKDLPDGYDRVPTLGKCDFDGKLATIGFKGLNGSLDRIDEQLDIEESAGQAVTRLPGLITDLNVLTPDAKEESSTAFRDLGDEARYFTGQMGQTTWNVLFLRRGKTLMYLDVVKMGAFTAEDLHRLAATAARRAASLS